MALCVACEGLLLPTEAQRCPHCERRVSINGDLANECRRALRIDKFLVGNTYKNPLLRATVDGLKFNGIRDAAVHLGHLMTYKVSATALGMHLTQTAVIPIPLHSTRLRERGFNQSELLAKHLSSVLKLPMLKKTLIRSKKTQQQAKLGSSQRAENVRAAFAVVRPLAYNRILLVDDVATTGSTLKEAARALRQSGAREIWAVVAAQG